jgi:hypothetical protein
MERGSYARSARDHTLAEVICGCSHALRTHGFAVIDHVIPATAVARVRREVADATPRIQANGLSRELVRRGNPRLPHSPTANAVLFLPHLSEFLAHEAVLGVAREMLDDHVRIAQFNTRPIPADPPEVVAGPATSDRGPTRREWHTDWPHMIHGGSNAGQPASKHMGSIRKRTGQPFPPICMCLSCVWYLTDVGPESGGTWVVPRSHLDHRNPFGPEDGITRSAPVPGEVQIVAEAGSIYIQDTRCAARCSAL